ncbi:hypothetical protein ED733_004606 [Metarhizium rileyi]|uniref:Killer toxin Kp4 domain-containing protein n=1 Tax=Metarhizium rileyi (strain RCEF 4871) TaxID=1649241 RepID=A0A5C6G9J0_METRR|nr:hypothetical protein ED733_004606 [Metarhizium rileyi]
MVSLSIIATFVATAVALGINCRGSGACNLNDAKLGDVLTQVKQIQAQGNGGHHYSTGGESLSWRRVSKLPVPKANTPPSAPSIKTARAATRMMRPVSFRA